MAEFVRETDLRKGFTPGPPIVDRMPVTATTRETAGNWDVQAADRPEVTTRLQEITETTLESAVRDALEIYPAGGIPCENVDTLGIPLVPAASTDLLTHFQNRNDGFRRAPGQPIDTARVRNFVAAIYGKAPVTLDAAGPRDRNLVQVVQQMIDSHTFQNEVQPPTIHPTYTDTVFSRLIVRSGPGADYSATRKAQILRDSILLHIARMPDPESVFTFLRELSSGRIPLLDTPGDTLGDRRPEAAAFLQSIQDTCAAYTADGLPVEVPVAIRNFMNGATPAARNAAKPAFLAAVTVPNPNRPPAGIAALPDIEVTDLDFTDRRLDVIERNEVIAASLRRWIEPQAVDPVTRRGEAHLLRGLTSIFESRTISPGLREQLIDFMQPNSVNTFAVIEQRLTALRDLRASVEAIDPTDIGARYEELRAQLARPPVRTALGRGGDANLYETININLDITHPARKLAVANRALRELDYLVHAAGVLTSPNAPWGESWQSTVQRGIEALRQDPPDMTRALDILGRAAAYAGDAPLRDVATRALQSIAGVSILSAQRGDQLLTRLLANAPGTWGDQTFSFIQGNGVGELNKDRTQQLVQEAEMYNGILSRIARDQLFETQAAAGTITPENNRIRLQGLDFLSQPTANILNFNSFTGTEDATVTELQAATIAEVLGLDPADPNIEQILRATDPEHILEAEQGRWPRILNALRARRGAIGVAAISALLSTASLVIPGIAVPAALLLGTASIGMAVASLVRASRSSGGMRNALRNMFRGMGEAVQMGFHRETARQFWLGFIPSMMVRAFIPGAGTLIMMGTELGLGIASEIHTNQRQRQLAQRVAGIRTLIAGGVMRNVTPTGGALVNVDVLQAYNRYRVFAQNERRRLEQEARAQGRTQLSPAQNDLLAENQLIARLDLVIRPDGTPDPESKQAAAVMREVILPERASVQEAAERVHRTSRNYAAILAGSASAGVIYGIARITNLIIDSHQAASTASSSSAPPSSSSPAPHLPASDSSGLGQYADGNLPDNFEILKRTRGWHGIDLDMSNRANRLAVEAIGQYMKDNNIPPEALAYGGKIPHGFHSVISLILKNVNPRDAVLQAMTTTPAAGGIPFTQALATAAAAISH